MRDFSITCLGEFYAKTGDAIAPQTRTEALFDLHVRKLQRVNNDRFRIYGFCEKGRLQIELETEFISLDELRATHAYLAAVAHATQGRLEAIFKGKHTDRWKADSCPNWHTGPDHDKPETQYRMSWSLPATATIPQVRKLMARMREATALAWEIAGMAVY